MATIKAFTDISQSKVLAEFLPIESADMCWIDRPQIVTDCPEVPVIPDIELKAMLPQNKLLPCWSLAALLSVVSEEVSLNSFKDGNWNAMVQQNGKMIYSDANNPIDACVAMIEKLHEQNLL